MIAKCQFLDLLILPLHDSGRSSPIVRRIDHPGKIIGMPSHRVEVGTSDARVVS
jgi:hypothetical protein